MASEPLLSPVEARVLGALIEKEITTPEYYPLSLNALVNACNQKSNRDPVVAYDDDTVEDALELLRAKGLAVRITGSGSRVPKHAHRFGEKFNFGRRELAILCELMLRGPQTVGELRNRSERMHRFDDLEQVETILQRLMEHEPDPLVLRMARQPGEKEARYAQLLSGEPQAATAGAAEQADVPRGDRITELETEVGRLREELASLRAQFAEFRRQFE
ncbi:MAG TPA: YceH family protein [Bryobacteraceae bacterium]|nr:YceH family protein [Bryobacteraceae bacterium]